MFEDELSSTQDFEARASCRPLEIGVPDLLKPFDISKFDYGVNPCLKMCLREAVEEYKGFAIFAGF